MLNDDELMTVVNELSRRHNWYADNIIDRKLRFQGLCAEIGISADNLVELTDFIIESHFNVPAKEMLELNENLGKAVVHSIWAGIEIGKKVASITRAVSPEDPAGPADLESPGDIGGS